MFFFFFSSRRRHRRYWRDWSSDVCSSDLGSIRKASPAGEFLLEHQVRQPDFNSYGARRGNHQVMMRGTFANIRIRNEIGRASCRERVKISVVAVSLKKKKIKSKSNTDN